MSKVGSLGVSLEWVEKIRSLSGELGISQRAVTEMLLERAVAASKAPEAAGTGEGSPAEPLRYSDLHWDADRDEEGHPWEGDDALYSGELKGFEETDDGSPALLMGEDAYVKPIVTTVPGQRDRDTVATGCPACERGAPRRGALHNCGQPNPQLGSPRGGL